MTLPRLISFSGYATAGKDAAADQFVKNDGYVKTYMSKPLEQALLTLDPLIDLAKPGAIPMPVRYSAFHAAVGYDKTKEHYEVRRLLQTLGTEIGREMFDPGVWVMLAEKEIDWYAELGQSVCITGVRFPNELRMIHERRGFAVWVSRPGVNPVNSHSSDNTISPEDCDLVVINDGTLDDLYKEVRMQLRQLGYEK